VCEWIRSDSLRKHVLGVEAAMREYARRPGEIIEAVAGHADFMGVPRATPLARTLYAVDELSGFVAACARVRPTGIEGMRPKSVRKKLKQPSFAAKVDRDQIRRGIDELGADENEHLQLVIEAMAANATALGLAAGSVTERA
jgi:predicted hydrolase (HD superfamily)